jgi:para-aminobenzoate synthetase/4-amino-4-deoxychorismate lyase
MTSTVAAKTAASLVDIFRALFPAASITGAPKIRTMQIIRELEPSCRGVYTGCIGYVAPNRKARFNVAIRTVQIDRVAGEAEYGVGGGIVWDSTSGGEYEECRVKAQVLTTPERPRFELLETLLYEPADGYFLLEEHLRRLEASAAYFDYSIDLSAIRDRLRQAALGFADSRRRVRLCLSHDGKIAIESAVLATSAAARPWRLKLAQSPVNSRDVFLYHKTTCRQPYDAALASRGDCDDVVLWNEDRQLTETTIANIVIQKGDGLVTPPVTCGLLAGVFRAHLLETGQIREEIVTVDDLRRAKAVFAINSVRKWLPAEVIL